MRLFAVSVSPPLLLLLLAVPASLLLTESSGTEERSPSVDTGAADSAVVLSRQRRNPLLIPVGAALLRVGGRYVVTIGTKIARSFKSRKDAVDFLRQPSTLRQIEKLPKTHGNVVNVPSKTIAKDVAKKLTQGKKPAHHPNPSKGNPHFHPVDKLGNLKPQHISHPKSVAKPRTKYSQGAKAKAAKASQAASKAKSKQSVGSPSRAGGSKSKSAGASKASGHGGSRGSGSRGSSSGGSRGGVSRGGSSGGSRGSSSGGSRGGGSRGGGSRGGSSGGSRGGGSRGGGSRGGSSGGSRGGSSGGRRG